MAAMVIALTVMALALVMELALIMDLAGVATVPIDTMAFADRHLAIMVALGAVGAAAVGVVVDGAAAVGVVVDGATAVGAEAVGEEEVLGAVAGVAAVGADTAVEPEPRKQSL